MAIRCMGASLRATKVEDIFRDEVRWRGLRRGDVKLD
jgi:Arc/MetJ family transcription regulator